MYSSIFWTAFRAPRLLERVCFSVEVWRWEEWRELADFTMVGGGVYLLGSNKGDGD